MYAVLMTVGMPCGGVSDSWDGGGVPVLFKLVPPPVPWVLCLKTPGEGI